MLEGQAWENPGIMGMLEKSASESTETVFSGNSQSGQYQDSTPIAPKEIPPKGPSRVKVPNSVQLIKLSREWRDQFFRLFLVWGWLSFRGKPNEELQKGGQMSNYGILNKFFKMCIILCK